MNFPDRAAIGKITRPVPPIADGLPPDFSIGKVTGPRHLPAALRYSLGGVSRLLRETAFRHELLAAVAVYATFAAVGANLSDYLIMAVMTFGLAAVEALNTAIEEIVDRISPEWSSTGLHAKDLGSFAVLCMLAANALMAGCIILKNLPLR